MSLSLCYLVRSTFIPVVTQFTTSETKPWPLLLLMFLLDASVVFVELMRYFVTCVDLPKRRNINIFYFKFLCSKGTIAAFNFLSTSLSLAKLSDKNSGTVFYPAGDLSAIFIRLFLFYRSSIIF